ncbi:hypothetical protein Tco_0342320, partial [Tanacetum coccineum]
DDTPLVSVYTTRNVLVRGMLIPDAFLTEEIRATDDFKEYETVSTPSTYRTPTISTASSRGKKRKLTTGDLKFTKEIIENNHLEEETKFNSNSTSK